MSRRIPIFKQKAYLSPIALLEISNHFSRCEHDELVLGVLLGSGNVIKSTIPLVATLEEGNIIIDKDLMSERLMLEEEISTTHIVGWYMFGDSEWKAQVHIDIEEECLEECFLLRVDMEKLSSSQKFPIDCFLGVAYGLLDSEQDLAFVKIPLEIETDYSSHAGMQVVRDLEAVKISELKPSLSDVELLKSSFFKVQNLLETLECHVNEIVAGNKEGQEAEGQFLADSLACIPKIDLEAFKTMLQSHLQDLNLIAHLANLTRMQLDIASKLQAFFLLKTLKMFENHLFTLSPRVQNLKKVLTDFVENECIPAEKRFYAEIQGAKDRWNVVPPVIEELKLKAKSLGLWNLFVPKEYKEGAGLTNLEYAVLCEIIGSCHLAAEATNTSAPDTGNMELLAKYGNEDQKKQWLGPLLEGRIRSAFCMTEPGVASSDAKNIQLEIKREGNIYILNGKKWWISGAGDPRCKLYIVCGKTDPNNKNPMIQQSILLVPSDTLGIKIVRPMQVFGYDDAPHGHMEIEFNNVKVPLSTLVLGEGRGFEIMQGRLGPGRIHHCMRSIGVAERALKYHIVRLNDPNRRAFGKLLGEHAVASDGVCQSRLEINAARLVVLNAAAAIDKIGAKSAMNEIAIAKVIIPSMCLAVIDRAIQAHGGAGVSQDFPLAYLYAMMRTLRIADGPDEVHRRQIARNEMKAARNESKL